MTAKFDVKVQAHSLAKLMAMAEACLTKAGGAIHAERLLDYTSGEFGRLTIQQVLEVLAVIDKDYEKKLLKDGFGTIIGYAHSKKLFVTLRRDQQSSSAGNEFAKIAKTLKARKTR
jgi:hypothetical protein